MLIDLSVELNESTPVYPGDPATKIISASTFDQNGYQDHYISIGTHVGTHMDAPSHMIEGGKNLDEFPIERFSGRGVCVDSFDFEAVQGADLQKGDIVLFRTGLSERYNEPEYFSDYPAMTEEVAQYLVDRDISIVGVDACSIDNKEDFPIHKLLLSNNVLVIENITNLASLKGGFRIHAYPLKLEADGAPVRVVAETS